MTQAAQLESADSDALLLERWQTHGDRPAMDELVRRNIHFVYGAARRQVNDATWAEDVTQAVFLLLIHKSPRIRSDHALAVWLHRATRYAAANARRMVNRRARRERLAAKPESQMPDSNASDLHDDLLPLLDEAIDRLPSRDRSGVMMCFFQRLTFGQIGSALGISEEAARKRVHRAVDRMRQHFARRGVITTGAAVSACLAVQATIFAPPALAGATASLAALSQIAGAGAIAAGTIPATSLMKGALHTMWIAKLKLAAAACAAIVLGGAVTATAIQQIGSALTSGATVVATSSVLAPESFQVKASDATEVTFLGVAKWGADGDEWHAINGEKIADPRGPFANDKMRARSDVTHQAMLYIAGQDLDGGYNVNVLQAKADFLYDLTPDANSAYLLIPFVMPDGAATADIELLLADGEWKNVVSAEHHPGVPLGAHDTEVGGISFTHISEAQGGGSALYVAHEVKGTQFEVVVTDAQGTLHRAHNINGGKAGSFYTFRYDFGLPPDQIASVTARIRPFNRKVTAKNVSLDPSKPTKPTIEVSEIKAEADKSK